MSEKHARLPALDLMRGLVMLLMAVDHSSDAFNGGRLFTDSVQFYHPGAPLPAAQFLVRWVTHLCAPTFLFLAGVGLAFSIAKERARGASERSIDLYLLVRGLIIWACELWVAYFVMPPGMYIFQVLYAIGSSYLFMIALRRLPARVNLALAIALFLTGELLAGLVTRSGPPSLGAVLLVTGGNPRPLIVAYPTLHWLALMLLGWWWGQRLLVTSARSVPAVPLVRQLAFAALGLFALFLAVRGLNSYGNMRLLRDDLSIVQWLHVSKYPPSLSYVALELSLMCAGLAVCFRATTDHAPSPNNPLMVLGQAPLFFYLLHFPLLEVSARELGLHKALGIGGALLGALAVTLVLYPACRRYRSYKAAHPRSLARFI
ncbi:MAG: heparan-alpha-glucosaminide N-acetyltransferase domain-containing protein [Polyangiaceae bacterium]